VILMVLNNISKQSFSVITSVTIALEVNLTICAIYIYILLTYLLTNGSQADDENKSHSALKEFCR